MDAWWRVKPRQHYWIAYCNDHKPEPGHVNSDMVWMLGERGDRLAEALRELMATVQSVSEQGYVEVPGLEILGEALGEADAALERDR